MSIGSGEKNLLMRAFMNQSRLKILDAVCSVPKNISRIARETKMDRSTVVYHLGLLSKVGLVTEELRPIKPAGSTGVMGRYYKVNREKLREAIKLVEEQLKEIKT